MLYRSGMKFREFLQAPDRGHVWHREVPVCYNNRIKSLFPPVVELLPTLPEYNSPFLTVFLHKLYRSVVL